MAKLPLCLAGAGAPATTWQAEVEADIDTMPPVDWLEPVKCLSELMLLR